MPSPRRLYRWHHRGRYAHAMRELGLVLYGAALGGLVALTALCALLSGVVL
jgi:hypothetical protein